MPGFEPRPVRVGFMVVKTALKKTIAARPDGAQSRYGRLGEWIDILPLSGIELRLFDRPANYLSNYKPA